MASTRKIMMARTIYGANLQTCMYTKSPFQLQQYTTINEKFNVGLPQTLPASVYPSLGYYGIGNGGHAMLTGAGGITYPQPLPHNATDPSLFNHIPFVLRLPSNDLTAAQRTAYAMRTTLTIAGVQYIAYYLKRLDLSILNVSANMNVVSGGVTTTTAFVPTAAGLNPTPPVATPTGTNVTNASYVTVSAPVVINFTQFDSDEYTNAATIITGTPNLAIISEMMLCSGIDKQVSASAGGGGTFVFNDAMAVQANAFISMFDSMPFTTAGFSMSFDLGSSEALLIYS